MALDASMPVDDTEGAEYAAALEEFIGRWNLREDSVNALVTLEPEHQAKVLQEFAPRDASRDVNSLFLKFASGIANNAPRGGKGGHVRAAPVGDPSPEVGQFVAQWSLGEEAQEVLLSLDRAMQNKVMEDFAPRDTSRDANLIFIKFAQSMSRGKGKGKDFGKGGKDFFGKGGKDFGKKGKGKGESITPSWTPSLAPLRPFQPLALAKGTAKGAPAQPGLYNPAPTEDPQEFVNMWKLDEQSQEVLFSMDADQVAKVMQEFKPRDTSRDVNRIFVKFASGIAENRDRGGPVAVLKSYVAKWSLNEDAQNIFFNLQPETQTRVMAEFAPRDASRDVSNIFMKFSQGLERGKGGFPGVGKGFGGKGFVRHGPYSS